MTATRPLTLGTLAAPGLLVLGACAMPVTPGGAPDGGARAPRMAAVDGYAGAILPTGELAVARQGRPFDYAEGAEARRAANALCGPRGVASGPEDNFRDGRWLFPGGCA